MLFLYLKRYKIFLKKIIVYTTKDQFYRNQSSIKSGTLIRWKKNLLILVLIILFIKKIIFLKIRKKI